MIWSSVISIFLRGRTPRWSQDACRFALPPARLLQAPWLHPLPFGPVQVSAFAIHRYLAEFDFIYSTRELSDEERTVLAIKGGEGKRLTYHQPVRA